MTHPFNVTDEHGFILDTYETLEEALRSRATPMALICDVIGNAFYIGVGTGWIFYDQDAVNE